MFTMPGKSFRGPLPPLTDAQAELAGRLRRDVSMLTEMIGERNVLRPRQYLLAADFIERTLSEAGYEVHRQTYEAGGETCHNLEAEMFGRQRADQIAILGAHYDSVPGTVGANDNASSVAALLAIARAFSGRPGDRTLRFVFFANEEPPFFQTEQMGSLVYARRCKQHGENITAMIALDGLGCYFEEPGSQRYPAPLNLMYPSTGNFMAFVGNIASRALVQRVVGRFRETAAFPSEGWAGPEAIPGIGFSDHWSFWQIGGPAVMATDTLPYRDPHYHTAGDTAEKVDYDKVARVVEGLENVMADLATLQEV